jgi:hypothetical protein
MRTEDAAATGGFAAAACVACCAPPIFAALGVTAGIAATVGILLGIAAAITVAVLGVAWVAARRTRHQRGEATGPPPVPVPVAVLAHRDPSGRPPVGVDGRRPRSDPTPADKLAR